MLTGYDSATNKKYWCQERAGEKRAILPKPLLAALSNKQIVCVEYDNLTDDQEREIFQVGHSDSLTLILSLTGRQRVQLGVALTPAGMALYFLNIHRKGFLNCAV